MPKRSKRCKKVCKARAKAKQKQTQVVSQKVVVNVGVRPRRRKKGGKRKPPVRKLKRGHIYDPFPQRLLATSYMQRYMPQFSTPNGRAMRPNIPGAIRGVLPVNVDAGAADLRGAAAMPDAQTNTLGWGPGVAVGLDPDRPPTIMTPPLPSFVGSGSWATMTHPRDPTISAPGSVASQDTRFDEAATMVGGNRMRTRYHTRYHARQLAREAAGRFGVGLGRTIGPAMDLVDRFLGIGHPEPRYAHSPAPSVMSGSSIGGGTASTGSAYRGRRR